ncbi:MAG: 4-hydroxybenzoyl-CoA thioesterase [Verrucomicrobiales bacterium]|nr:4-hydroxybenzoyl-CoA thioesterase [Verrucomicrobiales bacterium]|tara:strand:- start:11694 stop:12131 length:438 start_codon:yes stop_codon:yes gene_type:complete
MPHEHKIVRRVEFSETDMAGIVHFSNYFRFAESVEHDFFRTIGHSIVTKTTDPPVGWPRVHASFDFQAPLRFEDEFEVHLMVAEKKSRTLSYQIIVRKLTDGDPVVCAKGKLTVVCVTRDSTGKMSASEIPSEIADRIEVAPEPG